MEQKPFKEYVKEWGWQVEVRHTLLPTTKSFTNAIHSQIYVILTYLPLTMELQNVTHHLLQAESAVFYVRIR